MIYKLNPQYCLRGWKGAGCGLVEQKTGQVSFYKPAQYNLLRLANGMTDLAPEDLSEEEQQLLQSLQEKEIIRVLDTPSPIEPVQAYKRFDNRFVRSVLWSVTGRCNFRCRHCYMDAPSGALGEVSHEEAISIIDQMADCGIYDVALTGGEVFVRSDIRDLIAHLTARGIRISQIYTNGWLVNASILDYLDSLGQKPEFNFSFDGLQWHDWMRGVAGSEQRVLDAIALCQSRGFPTGAEACLHRKSVETLRETVKRMAELNTRIKVGSIMQTELWQRNSEGNSLTDEEYFEEMLKYIPAFFEDGMPANLTLGAVIKLYKGSTDYRIVSEKYDGTEACAEHRMCGAARMHIYITPDGRLLPCMPMTAWDGYTAFPTLQEVSLKQGLTDGFYMNFVNGKIAELFEKNAECNACAYKYRCGGGCRACALSSTNDLYGTDPTFCLYWKNGYVDRIRQVADAAIEKYCK